MATPPMSAVPDCDSQTRPAPTGCGHQMSAAQGCDVPVRELQSAPSGNHRCKRQQFKTVAAIRCQCQHSHSVAAITSLQSKTEAPTASIFMLWPRDANQDPSRELQSAPLPAFLCCGQGMPTKIPPRSSYASCPHSGRCHQFQTVAPRAPVSSTRCQCHDSHSVAAIVIVISSSRHSLPGRKEEGR